MNSLIRQRCGLIVSFGIIVASDMAAAAKANPRQRFAAGDTPGLRGTSNLLNIEFRPDQAAFLAGYLAAGTAKTGKVGTFGGIPLATVTSYMDGFAAGVLYYNRAHGTNVRVLGWNPRTRTGSFVSRDLTDIGAFADTRAASSLTQELIRKGADIIFPVDGPSGEIGSCLAVQRTRDVLLIGVDTDQHYATPDCAAQWLTSVMKIYRRMVYLAMGQIVHHQFKGGSLEGTLKNGGVGLAPFYLLAARVPQRLRVELARIRKEIVSKSISVDPKTYLTG